MTHARRLYELAVDLEMAGSLFYRTYSEGHPDRVVGELFEFLADEEDRHGRELSEILRDMPDLEIPGFESEMQPELKAYTRIFSGARLAAERADVRDAASALDFAIRREMDSIFLYGELSRVVPGTERQAVERLIEEERSHFRRLSALRSGGGGD